IGKEHGGQTCATLAALLLVLHPLQGWYGSEVRMYALAQAAGLALVWLGWRIIDGSAKRWDMIAYVLVAATALWIDYTVFLAWGLLQLIWLMRDLPRPRRWLALQAVVVLPIAIGFMATNQLAALRQTYQPIFLAVQANGLGLSLTPAGAAQILQASVLIGLVASLALAWYWRRHAFLGSPLSRSIVAALWIALVLVSIVPRGFTIKRMMIVLLPYLALATAYSLTRWPKSLQRGVVGLEVCAALLSLLTLQREPWREVIAEVLKAPSSVVWVDDLAVPVYDYYARRASSADRAASYAPLSGRDLPRIPEMQPDVNGQLIVITNDTSYRRLVTFLPASFYTDYQLLSEQHAPSIGVSVYRRRVQPDLTAAPPAAAPSDEWGLSLPSPLATCQP
ncbi:MAG TPA: hypothetical protein VMP08_18075, partial [Anaerolineae bacterium]|nr:hypothetical protein [Anaerolineae bacterium]